MRPRLHILLGTIPFLFYREFDHISTSLNYYRQQLKQDLEESDKMPKSIWEPIVLLEDKKPKETAAEKRIKELESKLSAVSKEKETYKKMLNKEQQQQLKKEKFIESMNLSVQNRNKKVDNHRFAPNCDDATENPSEEGS